MSSILRILWPYILLALVSALAGWYFTSVVYDLRISQIREDNESSLESLKKTAAESCAEQLTTQGDQCHDAQQKIVANSVRANDMSDRLRVITTATCGVLQAPAGQAGGANSGSGGRAFCVDSERVAELIAIAERSANTHDAAVTLDSKWPTK